MALFGERKGTQEFGGLAPTSKIIQRRQEGTQESGSLASTFKDNSQETRGETQESGTLAPISLLAHGMAQGKDKDLALASKDNLQETRGDPGVQKCGPQVQDNPWCSLEEGEEPSHPGAQPHPSVPF